MTTHTVTETAALQSARALQTAIAWPTLIYAVVVLALYVTSVWLALTGQQPLWSACLFNMLLVYAAYTPLHEATHDNIAYDKGRFGWLNHLTGLLVAAPMIHNYSLHRTTHLGHHMHTYDPVKDADHWVHGQNWITTSLRCFTIVYAHYKTGWTQNRTTPRGRRIVLIGALENALTLAFPLWLMATGRGAEALMVIILPAILGSGLLAFFFDYAVHYPVTGTDRFRRSRVYRAPAPVQSIITLLYVGQNYHQIHHLYPWVPFYRYPQLFTKIAPLLVTRGTSIVWLGRPPVVAAR
jgi:beta-carotene hydroxylase